jgi:hypothetical protein
MKRLCTLCGQTAECLLLKQAVHIVTTVLQTVTHLRVTEYWIWNYLYLFDFGATFALFLVSVCILLLFLGTFVAGCLLQIFSRYKCLFFLLSCDTPGLR